MMNLLAGSAWQKRALRRTECEPSTIRGLGLLLVGVWLMEHLGARTAQGACLPDA
jgi:hypothetical protein